MVPRHARVKQVSDALHVERRKYNFDRSINTHGPRHHRARLAGGASGLSRRAQRQEHGSPSVANPRKYPNAKREWRWQFVFPAAHLPRSEVGTADPVPPSRFDSERAPY